MSVLFSNVPSNQRPSTGHLLEFKAGRSSLEAGSTPDTRKVISDKTKGSVIIKQSNDQLIHFCWKNRETGNIEIDLIIFPGDTEFIPIKECVDGRVYMLKFKSGGDRRLFWMQEPKPDKDEEIRKKVNDLMNNPPAVRSIGGGRPITDKVSNFENLANMDALGNGDNLGALVNMDQNQLIELLSLMSSGGSTDTILPPLSLNTNADIQLGSSTTTPLARISPDASKSTDPAFQAIQLSQLREILSSIPVTSSRQPPDVDLSEVISSKTARDSAVANKDQLTTLLPDQEPVQKNEEELKDTLSSPQFRQAVHSFGNALQTGQLGPALQHFDLDQDAVTSANSGDMLEFAKKMTEAEQKKHGQTSITGTTESQVEATTEPDVQEPKPKRGKPDDNMDLD